MKSTAFDRWKPFAALGLGALSTTLALASLLAGSVVPRAFPPGGLTPPAREPPLDPLAPPLGVKSPAAPTGRVTVTTTTDRKRTPEMPATPRLEATAVPQPEAVGAHVALAVAADATEAAVVDQAASTHSVRRPTATGTDVAAEIRSLSASIALTEPRDHSTLRESSAALRERF